MSHPTGQDSCRQPVIIIVAEHAQRLRSTIYLKEDVIHVKIVLATALMAIARKVIILDMEKYDAAYLWGIASIIFALAIAYWLVIQIPKLNFTRSDVNERDG